jgi:hypothetical protein
MVREHERRAVGEGPPFLRRPGSGRKSDSGERESESLPEDAFRPKMISASSAWVRLSRYVIDDENLHWGFFRSTFRPSCS